MSRVKIKLLKENRIIYKHPYTPSLRHSNFIDRYDIYKNRSLKSLLMPIRNHSGHNNTGRICVLSRGGRHQRSYRLINYNLRALSDIPSITKRIEYDPNRSSFIALLKSYNGLYYYITAPVGLQIGDILYFFKHRPMRFINGHSALLRDMPQGNIIYNLENLPYLGGRLIRSAGCFGVFLKIENNVSYIKIPSGRVFNLSIYCTAHIGVVSNKNYKFRNYGKAGRMRWLGYRPHVRGVAMNPVDHPHGGGEGKKSPRVCPLSPWGKPTKWNKTRKKH
jgi:large subunit ribosomal protein L2